MESNFSITSEVPLLGFFVNHVERKLKNEIIMKDKREKKADLFVRGLNVSNCRHIFTSEPLIKSGMNRRQSRS